MCTVQRTRSVCRASAIMRIASITVVLAVLVVVLLLTASCAGREHQTPSSMGQEVHWKSCSSLSTTESQLELGTVVCGYVAVPENRSDVSGRTLEFHFAIAKRTGVGRKALFFFRGGPGLGGIETLTRNSTQFSALRLTHDLVFVDYRGTGLSNPLNCTPNGNLLAVQPYLIHFTDSKLYQHCRAQMPPEVDLDHYNTNNIVDDIETLRLALGYEKIDLHGNSYGSRVAQVYTRRHSRHVRSVVLDGPEDLTRPLGSSIATDSENSLRALVADCSRNHDCAKAYPNFSRNFEIFMQQLRLAPIVANVLNPVTQEPESASFSYDIVAGRLRSLLYDTKNASRIPHIIDTLSNGKMDPFLDSVVNFYRFVYGAPGQKPYLHVGLYASITCSEDSPFIDLSTAMHHAKNTMMGAERLRDNRKACDLWGVAAADPSFLDPVLTDIPTLILVGELDSITPPLNAHRIESHLKDAIVLIFSGQGHNVDSPCALDAKVSLVKEGSTAVVDTDCGVRGQRPPFFVPARKDQ